MVGAYFSFFTLGLAEITYRFTTCESTGFTGPSIPQCMSHYRQSNSPIVDKLFQLEEDRYLGTQGFSLSRDGIYNITVAGASGGEGVCNSEYGSGGVVSAQVRLTTDYEYLILVGQEGTSVCNVPHNANNPLCRESRPQSLEQAQACNNSWYNWTTIFKNGDIFYNFNGGGGGGGASMIWPRRVATGEFLEEPIAIGPGGGGASAVLDYDGFVNQFLPLGNFSLNPTASIDQQYLIHTFGHLLDGYYIDWPEGSRGNRPDEPMSVTSGSGGGWRSFTPGGLRLIDVDGKLLSQQFSTAEGGLDCSTNLPSTAFQGVSGGYGGGGGGCGSGGGGGGYTGGHVITNFNIVPGGGGDYRLNTHPDLPFLDFLPFRFNTGDGYVEIVASDCECAGECVVYTEEREFECLCPNDTLLAPDLSDCFEGNS